MGRSRLRQGGSGERRSVNKVKEEKKEEEEEEGEEEN